MCQGKLMDKELAFPLSNSKYYSENLFSIFNDDEIKSLYTEMKVHFDEENKDECQEKLRNKIKEKPHKFKNWISALDYHTMHIAKKTENGFKIEEFNTKTVACTCKAETKESLRKILPTGHNTKPVIIYSNCKRCCACALKRQLKRTAPPERKVLREFITFAKNMVDEYLTDYLKDFDYSFSAWYNHLTHDKQLKMDAVIEKKDNTTFMKDQSYTLFCKAEKQELGGKNRAIAGIDDCSKYIMGPVCWELETIFAKKFPGYCGGKNWEELEEFYNRMEAEGFVYTIQTDGSAFDLAQHYLLKEIDRYIYNMIADKVHHVDINLFLYTANLRYRKLIAKYYDEKQIKTLDTWMIDGTVLSGSSDTTLMNTLRQSLYMHFTLQKAGLRYGIDYYVLCKGDDAVIFVKELRDYESIFYKYWQKPIKDPINHVYTPHGIGQIAKFIKIGSIASIDFCSTSTIRYIDTNGLVKYKIIRKIDRLDPFTHYSRAATRFNNAELKQYMNDVADSINAFAPNIPIFTHYRDALKIHASKINIGKSKIRLSMLTDKRKRLPFDNHLSRASIEYDIRIRGMPSRYNNYGRDYIMAYMEKQSKVIVPEQYSYQFFLEKYGVSKLVIDEWGRKLLSNFNSFFYDDLAGSMEEYAGFC